MIVGLAGLPNVPFADLVPAVSPFRPWLSGVGSRLEHMSERVLGVVEREALDRARARLVALRAEQFRLWEDIAELERLGVAAQTGDRSSIRLLQECGNVDQPEAKRLVGEAADLTARVSLRGEPLPPRLPVTATVAGSGRSIRGTSR